MGYQHRLVLAALVAVVAVSCKKEEEERAPMVTIVAPGNGFDLSVPATLNVVADVSGEQDIDEVSFTITDANGVPIMEPFSVVPASNPARLEVGIQITSDLIADVFGAKGAHTRTAIGVAMMPYNAAVEIEAQFLLA